MGEEIRQSRFRKKDYQQYAARLHEEFALLREWFEASYFEEESTMGGFEQEAWLINQQYLPSPSNESFLHAMHNELLSPELAKFNVELNVEPQSLHAGGLRKMHNELEQLWQACQSVAARQSDRLLMTGILPTLQESDLSLSNMSTMTRYRVLNEQVLHARKGMPLRLDIAGREHLRSEHRDVMLESAATSFQIHRQVPFSRAKRYFNAAIIASAPTVALGANSPFLFGKDLWDETRIPVFEQAVEVGGYGEAAAGPIRRVTFGSGYVENSLLECFNENIAHFPVLLPVELDDPIERLPYLRLHNGTIWRWNRPLIGFDSKGKPHLRVEHRVIAAGPSIVDEIANAAFFFGLQETLARMESVPEWELEFAKAKNNFYAAARSGLHASVDWLDGQKHGLSALIKSKLLPMAREGLENLAMNKDDIQDYLGVIEARVASGRNGAAWQREYVKRHGADMLALTKSYLNWQGTGKPVHEWGVE